MAVSGYLDPSKIKTTERGIIVDGVLYSSLEINKNGIRTVKSLSLKSYKGDELSRMKDIQLLFADILLNSPKIDPKKLADYEWVVESNDEENPSDPTIESVELDYASKEPTEGEDVDDPSSYGQVLFQKNSEGSRQINPPFNRNSLFTKYPSNQKDFRAAFLQIYHLLNPNKSLPASSSHPRVGGSSLPSAGSTNRSSSNRGSSGRAFCNSGPANSSLPFQEELIQRANEGNASGATNRSIVSGSALVGPSSHSEATPPVSGTLDHHHSAGSPQRGRELSPSDPLPPPTLPHTHPVTPRGEITRADTSSSTSTAPVPRVGSGGASTLLSEVSDDDSTSHPLPMGSAITNTNLNSSSTVSTHEPIGRSTPQLITHNYLVQPRYRDITSQMANEYKKRQALYQRNIWKNKFTTQQIQSNFIKVAKTPKDRLRSDSTINGLEYQNWLLDLRRYLDGQDGKFWALRSILIAFLSTLNETHSIRIDDFDDEMMNFILNNS